MQKRSSPRDTDEPEVPDIGVPSNRVGGVDGKPPKDDGSSASELRLARRSFEAGVGQCCPSLLMYRDERSRASHVWYCSLSTTRPSFSVGVRR